MSDKAPKIVFHTPFEVINANINGSGKFWITKTIQTYSKF